MTYFTTVESKTSHYFCDNSTNSDQTSPGESSGWDIGMQCRFTMYCYQARQWFFQDSNGSEMYLFLCQFIKGAFVYMVKTCLAFLLSTLLLLRYLLRKHWQLILILQYSRMMSGKLMMELGTQTCIEGLLIWIQLLLHHKTQIIHPAIEDMLICFFQL
jgi:hypothetical protein